MVISNTDWFHKKTNDNCYKKRILTKKKKNESD